MDEMINRGSIFCAKTYWKTLVGRPRKRWEDIINIVVRMELAQDHRSSIITEDDYGASFHHL
jgi:hypothetical protein